MGAHVRKDCVNRMRRCHECNFPLGNRDLFCPRCGTKQRRKKASFTNLGHFPQLAAVA